MNILPAEAADNKFEENIVKIGVPAGKRPSDQCRPNRDANSIVIDGEVVAREMLGDQVLYKLRTPYGNISVKDFGDSQFTYGSHKVAIAIKDTACFDAQEKLRGFGLEKE